MSDPRMSIPWKEEDWQESPKVVTGPQAKLIKLRLLVREMRHIIDRHGRDLV